MAQEKEFVKSLTTGPKDEDYQSPTGPGDSTDFPSRKFSQTKRGKTSPSYFGSASGSVSATREAARRYSSQGSSLDTAGDQGFSQSLSSTTSAERKMQLSQELLEMNVYVPGFKPKLEGTDPNGSAQHRNAHGASGKKQKEQLPRAKKRMLLHDALQVLAAENQDFEKSIKTVKAKIKEKDNKIQDLTTRLAFLADAYKKKSRALAQSEALKDSLITQRRTLLSCLSDGLPFGSVAEELKEIMNDPNYSASRKQRQQQRSMVPYVEDHAEGKEGDDEEDVDSESPSARPASPSKKQSYSHSVSTLHLSKTKTFQAVMETTAQNSARSVGSEVEQLEGKLKWSLSIIGATKPDCPWVLCSLHFQLNWMVWPSHVPQRLWLKWREAWRT